MSGVQEKVHTSENEKKELELKYGSLIIISFQGSGNSFVYASGFEKNYLRLKNIKNSKKDLLFSRCLFQIIPEFINDDKKKVLEMIEKWSEYDPFQEPKKEIEFEKGGNVSQLGASSLGESKKDVGTLKGKD